MHREKDFPPLQNDLILRAAVGRPVERLPVWVMRQAGKYLPEYKKVREMHDFFEICKTPELCCEVTLQPIRRFDLDAAIIFSDILVVPEAMGLEIQMPPGQGPFFPNPIKTPEDMSRLDPDIDVAEKLGYVFDAITLTRTQLEGKCPLLGFSGAPWTLMAYMIEGKGTDTMSSARRWLYAYTQESHQLLACISKVLIKYLVGQVEAGAQMLQVFDSHAGLLGPDLYLTFGIPYLEQVAKGVKSGIREKGLPEVPMAIFAKGAHFSLLDLSLIGYDVLGIDWSVPPNEARKVTKGEVTLQGNLDPCALYASEEKLSKMVSSMVKEFGTQGYIANLGHGIQSDTELEKMAAFVNLVHEHSYGLTERKQKLLYNRKSKECHSNFCKKVGKLNHLLKRCCCTTVEDSA